MAASKQMGVITYSSLGAGLLSGKYECINVLSRAALSRMPAMATVTVLMKILLRQNSSPNMHKNMMKPATLAVAWVMANPAVTAPIIGARNLDQLEDSLATADFKMTEEMYAEINLFNEQQMTLI